MSQNVTVQGATYSDVPGIELPKQGGGTAYFADVSDTTAAASDVASGKYFYNASGVKTAGTSSGGGGTEVPENDVIYIDYDGTILYSYSAADFASLASHPANPSHSGLTAKGWNWTLADAKTYVAAYGCLVIGQEYITDDDKTRFYISIPSDFPFLNMSIRFRQTIANGVTVDWGDGSATQTYSGTSDQTITHTYSNTGDYLVTMLPAAGCDLKFYGTSSYYILGGTKDARRMEQCLKKVEFGARVTQLEYCFYYFSDLESVVLPRSLTSLGSYVFVYTAIKGLVIPSSVTGIGGNTREMQNLKYISFPKSVTTFSTSSNFTGLQRLKMLTLPELPSSQYYGGIGSSCYSLKRVAIPSGTTQIWSNTLGNTQVTKVTIPSSVTNMNNSGILANTHAIKEIHMKPTTPPTLGSNFLQAVTTGQYTIYVPTASLATYKAASNWSTFADYMVGE